MNDGKRERRRRKSAREQKKRARAKAQQASSDARIQKSYEAAQRAEEQLETGETAEAVRVAARAAELNPHDPAIAQLYFDAAERARDRFHEARAFEHVCSLAPPDVRLFAQLAFLHLRNGDDGAAEKAVKRARQLLPSRMKDRKRWRSMIEYVEAALVERGSAAGTKHPATKAPRARSLRGSGAEPARARAQTRSSDIPRVLSRESAPDAVAVPTPPERPSLTIELDIARDVDGLDVLSGARFSHPGEVHAAVLAVSLRDAEAYDRLLAVERAHNLLPFPHQEDTVRKVLSEFLGRALLADEVGLGKTIEAGLILSECMLRGRVARALVLTPPSLVAQWREELSSKFAIDTRTTEDAAFRRDPEGFWSGPGVIIASLATARMSRQRELVTSAPWDLVIVDEAHMLKNAATESHQLAARLSSRFLLLLTATPVENRIEELYNLVSLIRPGHLGGRTTFLRRFSDSRVRSSEAARAEVRTLLAQIMVRNTRALSGVRLPPRFARTVLVQPDPAEAELYELLAAALRTLGSGGRTRLLLSTLLQEAGSSPLAVRATLQKVASGDAEHAAALTPAIRAAERSDGTAKSAALLRLLEDRGEPTVVFTRFRATLDHLGTILARAGIIHERIDGNVPPPLRNEAIDRVRHRGGVLLSTEVGAEGLNLQFCRRIVNFDLPWNPMRIEQRIGRVHRIGQDHAVDVVNFCLAGSIEERILGILDDRINLFELVVGEVEMILGYLEEERDFADIVFDAFSEPDNDEREQSFTRIGDALAAARTRYDNVKRFDEAFFRNELGA